MLQTPEETTEKENSLGSYRPPWPIAGNPLVFACGHWSDHHCTSLKLCDHPRFQIHFRFLHLYFWLVLLPCGRWTRDGSLRQPAPFKSRSTRPVYRAHTAKTTRYCRAGTIISLRRQAWRPST